MHHQECRCELLAGSEVGHVGICRNCGHIQLSLQYLTLRFEEDAFRALVHLVNQARSRIDSAAADKAGAASVAAVASFH